MTTALSPRSRRVAFALALGVSLASLTAACGSDGGSGSAANFCSEAKKADKAFNNVDPSDSDQFPEAIAAIEDLTDGAPSEIKDDLETLLGGFEAIKDIDFTDPEAAQKALDGVDEDKVQQASDNVEKYLEDECGITSK